jgi:F0F1-type ATP synthase assembly protein I
MKTLPSIPEKPLSEAKPNKHRTQNDAFEKQISKHNRSKSDHILNLIYSILVGVLSGFLTKKHSKHSKIIGLLLALTSYMVGKKASLNSFQ